jgi:hypothetical protein
MPETKLAQADTPTNNDTICCALPCLAVHSAIPPPHKTFMRCCTENHSGWPSLQGHRQNEMTEHVTERICWRSGCKRRNAVHAGGGVAPTKETSVFRSTFSVPDLQRFFLFPEGQRLTQHQQDASAGGRLPQCTNIGRALGREEQQRPSDRPFRVGRPLWKHRPSGRSRFIPDGCVV